MLPGEVTYGFCCALDSARCRPVRPSGILDFKMKSEVTALVYNFNCDVSFTNQTDQKD
jgi:hypothetical protein